jgi:hypothetical protein
MPLSTIVTWLVTRTLRRAVSEKLKLHTATQEEPKQRIQFVFVEN